MTYPQAPSNVELVFEASSNTKPLNEIDLVFGATGGQVPGAVLPATLGGRFVFKGAMALNYDNAVFRGLSARTTLAHSEGADHRVNVAAAWQPSTQARHTRTMRYQEALDAQRLLDLAWDASGNTSRPNTAKWGKGLDVQREASSAWFYGKPASREAEAPWQRSATIYTDTGLRHFQAAARHPDKVVPWQQGEQVYISVDSLLNQAAKVTHQAVITPWQQSLLVQSYGGPWFKPPDRPADPPTPLVDLDLAFCQLYSVITEKTTLIFGLNPCGNVTPDALLYILPARFYMAVHSIEAHILPSLTSIPIYDVSLAADSGSFAWTFSASGPALLFDALAPSGGIPAQIRITIDGIQWVFMVDSLQRQTEFGSNSTRIAGRSVTAAIGQPYSRESAWMNATGRNAQQLAADALDLSGVALDWGITDWLVPAGAWSFTGTPLAAVQAIAEAAGGFVNSHRSASTLLVRHPYPTLPGGIPGGPWNWNGAFAADVELAPDSIITSAIERKDGPDINGVYVSGVNQGVLALVRRDGTTGNKLAAMISDQLITASAAASQRGLSVLGQAGAKHTVQISLPILTGGSNPGVLDVGQLVQINESVPWRGRVRSVSVQADMPSVRQTITLERHL